MTEAIMPGHVLSVFDPEWIAKLSDHERYVLPWVFDLWLRPEQHLPRHHWRSCGYSGGRGFGKSLLLSTEINRRVAAGLEKHIALMAPTETRVEEVQIQSLIDNAPPWDRPERYRGGLRWSNGVTATVFTPEAPGRSRSENISLAWLCEIVDWKASTRVEAYENIATATRIGRAQIVWDSTSKGRNDLLCMLRAANARDPHQHVIVPGTTFSNPLLALNYLRDEYNRYSGVRRDEEIFGMSFDESAGALWKQAWLDGSRVEHAPDLEWTMVAVDPAQSTHETSDATGICVGGRGRKTGHAYVTEDLSGKMGPEEWGDLAVSRLLRGGRCVIERNHLGDNAVYVLRSRAAAKGLLVKTIGSDEPWPSIDTRCIHVREVVSRDSKADRAAGPATETEAGRVHLVGQFPDLELELTTWIPGVRRSPNRLDAMAFLVTELRELAIEVKTYPAEDVRVAAQVNAKLQTAMSATTSPLASRNRPRYL